MAFDIRAYCLDKLEGVRKSTGPEVCAACPFCGKGGRFYVNTETGAYICFKCDERGRNMRGLIAQVEGITPAQAGAYMMRQFVEFKRREETAESLVDKIKGLRDRGEDQPEPQVDFDLPKEFRPVWSEKGGWQMPLYLKKRGFKKATARAWGLGFCRSGYFAGRVIIPVRCPNGHSFTARDTTGQQEPRYLNPKGADHGRLLLGWDMTDERADLAVVEGPLDAIKMWQHGIPAVALMGKVLHPEQASMMFRRQRDASIVVMLDPEEALPPYQVAGRLSVHFDSVYIAKLPDGVDPGASTRDQARRAYDAAKRYTGQRTPGLLAALEKTRKKLSGIYQ